MISSSKTTFSLKNIKILSPKVPNLSYYLYVSWPESCRAFHGFGQARFPDGGSVLGSSPSQFFNIAPAASNSKVVKINQKIIISVC